MKRKAMSMRKARFFVTVLNKIVQRFGYSIDRRYALAERFRDFTAEDLSIIDAVIHYTMTSIERLFALISATRYIVKRGISGAIVECGVWRGGSMMAVAKTLLTMNIADRDLYLFDTFAGMVEPTEYDIDHIGNLAKDIFRKKRASDEVYNWCYASLEEVSQNLLNTGYPAGRLHFIKGKIEETIPEQAPEVIALLRLDTDWYQSTLHELVHLYPRLSVGGILIIDDYGHWLGSRRAVDEYFEKMNIRVLLNRIDYTGRLVIKP